MVTEQNSRDLVAIASRDEQLDELCERFEAAWKAGQSPRIEDYLAEMTSDGQAELMLQLLAVEFWHCRECGMPTLRDKYRARFPSFGPQIDATLARPEFQQQLESTQDMVPHADGTPREWAGFSIRPGRFGKPSYGEESTVVVS